METSDTTENHSIIYITEEDHRREWSYDATKELLKLYDEKVDMLDTGIISTYKKLWELTSKALAKKGFDYTPGQCENKWKSLKRSYINKLEKLEKMGTSKRPCPFEFEIAEILSKRPNDSFNRSYTVKINELKKQEDLFKINLNEPPGFSKAVQKDTLVKDEQQDNGLSESPEPTYTVIQEGTESALFEDLTDLKKILFRQNKINTRAMKQSNEIQSRILDCLERTAAEQSEIRRIQEKQLEQQDEMLQQMRIQNELLEKLLDKFS